jgi:hypothetical protein
MEQIGIEPALMPLFDDGGAESRYDFGSGDIMAVYSVSPEPTSSTLRMRRHLPWWVGISAALLVISVAIKLSPSLAQSQPAIADIARNVLPLSAAVLFMTGFALFGVLQSIRNSGQTTLEVTPAGVGKRYLGMAETFFPIDHIAGFRRARRGGLVLLAKSPRSIMTIPENLLGLEAFTEELRGMGIAELSAEEKRKILIEKVLFAVVWLLSCRYVFFGHSPRNVAIGEIGFLIALAWPLLRSGSNPYMRPRNWKRFAVTAIILAMLLASAGMSVWKLMHPRPAVAIQSSR